VTTGVTTGSRLARPSSTHPDADVNLGNERNGPIDAITVVHQLHLSRFTNMAK
jgi:replicative DNA helicase